MIAWEKCTRVECVLIGRIARRALAMMKERGIEAEFSDLEMDITAVHVTSGLMLKKLESADDMNFAHDVCGIRRHLDRDTGELRNCFVPRCAGVKYNEYAKPDRNVSDPKRMGWRLPLLLEGEQSRVFVRDRRRKAMDEIRRRASDKGERRFAQPADDSRIGCVVCGSDGL